MLRTSKRGSIKSTQLSLNLATTSSCERDLSYPSKNVSEFLDLISDTLPDGDIYLFGGILRDMALFGRKGFNSDIDLVVENNWNDCARYIESLGARKNKFGGYRLEVGGWPIDIWNARETWAIKQGLVPYLGIRSLTETTVLNWDAILMNWRTRRFVCREGYLDSIKERNLDIVLEQNPNPIGMAVRVFRHLCIKDAKKITISAAEYLANCTSKYSFDEIRESEIHSYGNTLIKFAIYKFFEGLKQHENLEIQERIRTVSTILKNEGMALSSRQFEWNFNNNIRNEHI